MTNTKRIAISTETETVYDLMNLIHFEIARVTDKNDILYTQSRKVCREILTLQELLKGVEIWQIQTR